MEFVHIDINHSTSFFNFLFHPLITNAQCVHLNAKNRSSGCLLPWLESADFEADGVLASTVGIVVMDKTDADLVPNRIRRV